MTAFYYCCSGFYHCHYHHYCYCYYLYLKGRFLIAAHDGGIVPANVRPVSYSDEELSNMGMRLSRVVSHECHVCDIRVSTPVARPRPSACTPLLSHFSHTPL